MPEQNVVEINQACKRCGLYHLCGPMGLDEGDMSKLDSVLKRRRSVQKGELLYRQGEAFDCIYAVRSGSFKTYTLLDDGTDQVTGFQLAGDLLGLDAISSQKHSGAAKALETSSVCEIPFERIESLADEIPGLHHHLMSLMSAELQHDQCKLVLLAKMPAEAKLATFLLNISERLASRGYSACEFNLSMSRNDIANLMGLAVETVSRLFSQFQEQGLLNANRKHITLLDRDAIRAITARCSVVDNNSHAS
jgi:CRP/FNR family transcriptional regulator